MKKVNLGLAGLGGIGKVHLHNALLLDSAEVVAVCDLSRKSLNYARKLGVKRTYSDFEKLLLDRDVDAIVISLPTYLHREFSERAAEAGKHIFLEKPLARNESEAKEIVRAIEKSGVKAMVGYPLRYTMSFAELKKTLSSGVIGEVQIANATNIWSGALTHRIAEGRPAPVPQWYWNKELTGGGALIDLGVHLINLLRWYFGEIAGFRAYLGYRFNLAVEDHAIGLIKFKEGTVSTINVGWFSAQSKLELEFFGTANHLSAYRDNPPGRLALFAQKYIGRKHPLLWSSYFREIGYFVRCIKHDLQPQTTAQDAMKDVEAVSLAYKNRILLD